MLDAARERLAKAQTELVRALVAQAPIPAGFDEARVHAAARSLVSKRRQVLARAWPSLLNALGDSYVEAFTKYAQTQPLPACATPRGDGRAFLRWLESQQPLNDAARLEAIAFDLRLVAAPRGLRPRRGFGVKLARLSESRALVIAVRIPWLGVRWWRYPRK